jgi:23S rRNA pseudouridine2605 synthase
MEIRLQKYLAKCGIASRRVSERLIKEGLISVNNEVITDMGVKIDTKYDVVKYRGKIVKYEKDMVYIMLNKPVGYVTTVKEQFNRPKVTDLIKGIDSRIYPVGRLDYNTSGLIFMTNDGDLTFKLTHPSHEVEKVYLVLVKGIPNKSQMDMLNKGVCIGDYITRPSKSEIIKIEGENALLSITIHEGKNRQVRKMVSAIDHDVIKLKRVAIGELKLGDLKTGSFRYLTAKEINYLKSL